MRVIDYIANNGLFDKLSCDFCVRRPEVLGGGGKTPKSARYLNNRRFSSYKRQEPETALSACFVYFYKIGKIPGCIEGVKS